MPEKRLQKAREAYRSILEDWEPPTIRLEPQTFEWSKIVVVELDVEEPTAETPWAV